MRFLSLSGKNKNIPNRPQSDGFFFISKYMTFKHCDLISSEEE